MEQVAIKCDKITHYYGERLIYKDLSFEVKKGSILGLLGKNGTGKTTIINILNGYLKPHSGCCSIFGEPMDSIRPETKARVGLLLEGHVQHDFFNVIQIEKFYSKFFPNWNRDVYFELLKRLQVTTKQPLSTMSCGQRSQVALGLLFAQNPDILILDDFSMGLDPGYRRLFVEYLKEYATAEDKTIFLTSHIIQDMEMLIDDCMILDYGRILTHRPTFDIIDNFKRFTFSSQNDFTINDDRLWNLERMADGSWECYSFCSQEEVAQILTPSLSKDMRCESLSLEDAFIGLTGKY
ncbi:MAG: ABC transporter ATP-binding protein [Rikenellaceae bacterium]